MRRVIRSVLDPGVFVSAALTPGGTPDRLLTAWGQRRLEVVSSPKVLGELAQVLRRDKFRSAFSGEVAERYLDLLRRFTTSVADPPLIEGLTSDRNDDYLPSLGRAVGADIVVSGNTKHMRPGPSAHPPIATPAQLLNLLADVAPAAPSARTRRRSAALAAWRVRRQRDVHRRGPGQERTV
ncbi:MAG: putative toxin-antitoxin system toxin component, PIN family [Candidatus Dormibacteraeota bacterium]|nr:putative toxin-antitoxin system toxin component, PIN family [Candidatus Dormibacteraeota bacterium]MBO0761483.1 putative toxin-antitoxin system toxin component, PIN family [Candidatus Dormibacteraeota bacterium]